MSVEGRGWVTRVGIDLVNWQQEEPADFDGRRQLSKGGTSRMSREAQVRICERLGAKLPGLFGGNAPKELHSGGPTIRVPDPDWRVPQHKSRCIIHERIRLAWINRYCRPSRAGCKLLKAFSNV